MALERLALYKDPACPVPEPDVRSISSTVKRKGDGDDFECDYDTEPHPLYDAIGNKLWRDVEAILDAEEDKYPDGMPPWLHKVITNPILNKQTIPQSKLWVVRKNEDGTIKWRVMPLHAAAIFDAPIEVLRRLIDINPEAATLMDSRGNLPLHHAFSNGLEGGKISLLMEAYPEGKDERNDAGETPIECAQDGIRSACMHLVAKEKTSLATRFRQENDMNARNLKNEHRVALQGKDAIMANLLNKHTEELQEKELELQKLRDEHDIAVSEMKWAHENEVKGLKDIITKLVESSDVKEEILQLKEENEQYKQELIKLTGGRNFSSGAQKKSGAAQKKSRNENQRFDEVEQTRSNDSQDVRNRNKSHDRVDMAVLGYTFSTDGDESRGHKERSSCEDQSPRSLLNLFDCFAVGK